MMPEIIEICQHALSAEMPHLNTLLAYLSPDEQAKMQRFAFQPLRDKYGLSRGLLRKNLARQLQCDPKTIEFIYNAHGKPELKGDLHFNLSHAQDQWCLAIASKPVGIDIEYLHRPLDALSLARRFFAPTEVDYLESCSPALQQAAFFRLWVAKEAVVKALGVGLMVELNTVLITLEGEKYGVVAMPGGEKLTLENLPCAVGYRAAVAVVSV